MLKSIITVDVENDWGGRQNSYVGIKKYIPVVLNILKKRNILATFFVSGNVVRKNREIIYKIKDHGHEIASHGFIHENYHKLGKAQLLKDILKSRQVLEKEIGVKPVGFRAPQFNISKHLFEVLKQLEFKYDSSLIKSITPGGYKNLFYNRLSQPLFNNILEFPVSTIPYLKIPLGIKWLNALSPPIFKIFQRKLEKQEILILYMHPFDFVERPDSKGIGININFFTKKWYNFNSEKMEKTLIRILNGWKKRKFLKLRQLIK